MELEDVEVLAHDAVDLPNGCGHPMLADHGDSWSGYYKFLYLCMKRYKFELAVECGVNQAIGSCHMSLGNPDAMVVGIDRAFHPNAFIHRQQFPNIWFIDGDTMLSAPVVKKTIENRRIGLLFLDSTHVPWVPQGELEVYKPMLAPECIVACDDVAVPAMTEFWDWIPYPKVRVDFLHPRLNTTYDEPGFGFFIVKS